MPSTRPNDLLLKARKIAEQCVREAGRYLLAHKKNFEVLNYKDLQDIVTSVDLAVEKQIIQTITAAFPDHSLFSEEVGEIKKSSDYTWVIDPLDGTKEYVRDIPLYCSAVMLEKNGEPLVSAIYDPELDELYSAAREHGASLNHKPITVSHQADLNHALLFTYLPKTKADIVKLAPLFDKVYRIRGHANHNMSYCWVAKGGYDGHFSLFTPTKWWDIAPGILLVREAGGKVTDLEGVDITHENYHTVAIGTNGKIHDQLLNASQKLF